MLAVNRNPVGVKIKTARFVAKAPYLRRCRKVDELTLSSSIRRETTHATLIKNHFIEHC